MSMPPYLETLNNEKLVALVKIDFVTGPDPPGFESECSHKYLLRLSR